jgi:hypothetical protein
LEAEIEFEVIGPWDVRIEALLAEFVGKILIMGAQEFCLGGL